MFQSVDKIIKQFRQLVWGDCKVYRNGPFPRIGVAETLGAFMRRSAHLDPNPLLKRNEILIVRRLVQKGIDIDE